MATEAADAAEAAEATAQGVSDDADEPQDIVVVGSQIRGAKTTGAIPVSVIGADQIEGVGAVSSNELFRSIPQAGDVTFNESSQSNANYTRGDIATVSLRGLGPNNTLVLLNGRRVLLHPESQLENQVPIFGYNVNAIPVAGIERLEVLRDGAAALYGSDAVAGVVNTVLQSDFKGAKFETRLGAAEGTGLWEFSVNGLIGTDFAQGRGNITVFGSFMNKTALDVGELDYTASNNRSSLVEGTSFEGVSAFDTRSTRSAWGQFTLPSGYGTVTSNGTAVTNASGVFHIQPTSMSGCGATLTTNSDICVASGTLTGNAYRSLRQDTAASFPGASVTPGTQRFNFFSFINYELGDSMELFSEIGFYHAKSTGYTSPNSMLSTAPITISKDAYWNPFGSVNSPNRLPGLDIPEEGLDITISSLNLADAGLRRYDTTNEQYRLLVGLRGELGGWSWESAGLYTWATVDDTIDAFSSTLLQAAINRTTSDAYNPFAGGNLTNYSVGSSGANLASTIDSFRIKATRYDTTTLGLWDFKLSNSSVFDLPAGGVGLATGVEARRETFSDDRSSHQDGSDPYIDAITGINYGSDFVGQSTRKDVTGHRTVLSAYAEAAVPLVSPDMEIPLVHKIDLQIAGRFEHYSDVGSVARPKIAGAWDVVDGLRFRASWSGGFRAPNLEVINTPASEGVSSGVDYVRCEADLRAGRISSFSECAQTVSVQRRIAGNQNLKPETSTSFSYGMVFEPQFLPPSLGRLVFTVDRWRIKQKNVVGVVNYQNAITLDYLLRAQGSYNPEVVRAEATADDEALVAGTGLEPAGEILYVALQYQNLQPVEVSGIDFSAYYRLPDMGIGSLTLNANASYLTKYFQSLSEMQQQIVDAQAAGTINNAISVGNAADLRGVDGNPKWKFSLSATFNSGPFQLGLHTQYTGPVKESSVYNAAGDQWTVNGQMTANLYAQYAFTSGSLEGTTFQVGVRNLTDASPPLSSSGYLATLYTPVPRYWYGSIKKRF